MRKHSKTGENIGKTEENRGKDRKTQLRKQGKTQEIIGKQGKTQENR